MEVRYEETFTKPPPLTAMKTEDVRHDWQTCEKDDCEECQALVDHGIVMACNICGSPGLVDLDHHSWRLFDGGQVACVACFERHELEESVSPTPDPGT